MQFDKAVNNRVRFCDSIGNRLPHTAIDLAESEIGFEPAKILVSVCDQQDKLLLDGVSFLLKERADAEEPAFERQYIGL